jgi:2-aminophenol/2-amino-5-chlorophenol 1,6-dioxygenase alpha subunit
MPHLLAGDPAEPWAALRRGAHEVGRRIRADSPDTLVVISTQWFTVLGHQLQLDPRPTGTRMDENWYAYDYGSLDYGFDVDVEFTEAWAAAIEAEGFQARRTRYDDFPIDTGTIVAQRLLDPDSTIPLALVSCNLYAAPEDLGQIAACARQAAVTLGRRIACIAISGLSSGLIQEWIEPAEDRIDADHDTWNRRMLKLLESGDLDEAFRLREEYSRNAAADSQLRALSFLQGTGAIDVPAEVLAYGPVWGTGAAVIHWAAKGHTQ